MAEGDGATSVSCAVESRPVLQSPLGWAVFLASSWTWCIGMFLPVLLVRDYGIWGWVVFAIPNVIGAAAMGWTVRDAEASRRLVAAHRPAVVAFAIVTIAFQVFFGAWYFRDAFALDGIRGAAATGVVPLVTAIFVTVLFLDDCPRSRLGLAAAAYLVSIVCFAVVLWIRGIGVPIAAESPQSGLWALALASALGFALCPYLDPTFHDARQQMSVGGGRFGFGLGFGLLFLLMIVFTLTYARGPLQGALLAVVVHLLVQLAFTSAVHLNAILRLAGRGAVAATCIGLLLMLPLGYFGSERVYRLFLSFYGLVFPAYVWLCMLPRWREPEAPGRRSVGVLIGTLVLAGPFYYIAFIDGRMEWAAVGVAIVLAGRLGLPMRRWRVA